MSRRPRGSAIYTYLVPSRKRTAWADFDVMRIASQSETRPSIIRTPDEQVLTSTSVLCVHETTAPNSNRRYPDPQFGVIFLFSIEIYRDFIGVVI